MSESTSSMSDSTSHDNGESARPKPPPNICLCFWRLSDIFISVMSLTGAVAGRQEASHSKCVTLTQSSG